MHEGRRPFVHLFSSECRPEVPKGRILVNGLGCGIGRLPGVPGCDILELRIWYKNRSTVAGLALPDVGAERILFFFRRGACDER